MNNNVIKFTDPRKAQEEAREQACLWLARLDRGAAQEELDQLASWLRADPLHVTLLLNMAAMWDQATILAELSEIFPLADAPALHAKRARSHGWAVAGAGLAAAVLCVGLFVGLQNSEFWTPAPTLDTVYATAIGERRQINLPDGSIVTLNTNTRARFIFDGESRAVVLDHGEGFFTVAKDAARPFRVHAGARVVEAVGTAFTVQHEGGQDIEVLVTEGKVNFREAAPPFPAADASAPRSASAAAADARDTVIPLVAGERLTIAQEVQQIEREKLQAEEVEVKLAWRMGMLVFQGDSLETVLQEVSRYTTVKLQADGAIRDIRIDGIFPAGDIDRLLIAMEKNFNLDSQRIGEDEILLTARPPEE